MSEMTTRVGRMEFNGRSRDVSECDCLLSFNTGTAYVRDRFDTPTLRLSQNLSSVLFTRFVVDYPTRAMANIMVSDVVEGFPIAAVAFRIDKAR